jgi:hypothetical protein
MLNLNLQNEHLLIIGIILFIVVIIYFYVQYYVKMTIKKEIYMYDKKNSKKQRDMTNRTNKVVHNSDIYNSNENDSYIDPQNADTDYEYDNYNSKNQGNYGQNDRLGKNDIMQRDLVG